jgi:hypothetical protein
MFVEVPLHRSPKKLNEIELTVEFRQEDTKVTGSCNNFLNERFLFFKIRLQLQYVFATTSDRLWIFATSFALAAEFGHLETVLQQNGLDAFGLIREVWMIAGEVH